MKKVLVTGGAGFIGSHTAVELHNAGYLPVVVDNFVTSQRSMVSRMRRIVQADFPVHDVDCRDEKNLERVFEAEAPIEGVIHFAAYKAVGVSVERPLDYFDNNLNSLIALLRTMQRQGVRNLVFSSSCTVYGQPDQLPVTEESPIKPAESPYGRTKQMCESIIDDVVASGADLKAVTLRYFNPIGAHPSGLIGESPLGKPENLVPYITQTAVGLREELTVFGNDYPTRDGTCIRDYIHVMDLADAHVCALGWQAQQDRARFNEVINVGTGVGVSVLEAIAAFEEASGTKLRYRVGPRRSGDVVETYASVDRSRAVLGWQTKRSLVDALRDAYNWQLALQTD